MKNKIVLFVLVCMLGFVSTASAKEKDKPSGVNLKYNPSFNLGGIKLNTDELGVAKETCESPSIATIDSDYFLTDKLFIFKTDAGYGVASIDLSYRDLETGRRRTTNSISKKTSCKVIPGMQIDGEFDCIANKKLARKVPYEQCAYDIQVFGHSMEKEQAFKLVYKKLQEQFLNYRDQCVVTPKTTIQDRMLKF